MGFSKPIVFKTLREFENRRRCSLNSLFNREPALKQLAIDGAIGFTVGAGGKLAYSGAGDCTAFLNIHYNLRDILTQQGYEYHANDPEYNFRQLSDTESVYHTIPLDEQGRPINIASGQNNNEKWTNSLGYEIIFDENGNIVTDSVNTGTYNFYSKDDEGTGSNLIEGFCQ